MGRKAFVKDLEDAAIQESFAQIADVRAGTDDGTVNFVFKSAALPTGVIMIEALIPGTCMFAFAHGNSQLTCLQRFQTTRTTTCTSYTPLAVPVMFPP
jgi:hypothetical protein